MSDFFEFTFGRKRATLRRSDVLQWYVVVEADGQSARFTVITSNDRHEKREMAVDDAYAMYADFDRAVQQ